MTNQIKKHPLYEKYSEKYIKYSDFYKGGDCVENNESYLPQHIYESSEQYEIRQKLATYKNLARPIVSVFSSAIWRKEPIRNLPTRLIPFIDNVDGNGTSANTFFQSLCSKIACIGVYFVIIDSNKAPKDMVINSIADAQKAGIIEKMIPIDPLNLVAWGFDQNNNLKYVVLQENIIISNSPFEPYKTETKYKIWFPDKWELYISNEETGFTLEESGLNKSGVIPIVSGYFKKEFEMVGESCFDEVISLLIRAYNLENAYDKSLFDTAFPQQLFTGFEDDQIKDYIRSASNGLSGSSDADSKFVEPTGRSFDALERKIKSDEQAIQEIVLRMIKTDTKMVESAKSKEIDKQQLDSQLAVFSRNCEEFEVNCWKTLGKWLGMKDSELEGIEIKYNRDFDVEKISPELVKVFYEMVMAGLMSYDTFWTKLIEGEMLPNDFDMAEEKAKIENDSRTGSTFADAANNTLTGTAIANDEV